MTQIISMRNPIVFLIWYLTYCFFYYVVIKSLFRTKNMPPTIFCWILSLLYLIAKYSDSLPYYILIPGIIGVIVYAVIKRKDAFKFIGSILFANILLFLTGIIFAVVLLLVLGDNFTPLYSGLKHYQDYLIVYISAIVLIPSFALFYSGLIKLVKYKKKSFIKQQTKYIFFLWIPITHTVTFIFFMLMFSKDPTRFADITKSTAIFALIIFIFDFITFFVIEKYENLEIQNKKYEQQIMKNELDYQKTVLLNESEQEIGKIRHDLNNILILAKGFIEIGNNERAIKVLENATKDLNTVKGIPICSNAALNTILKIKCEQAMSQNITLNVDVNETSPLLISEYDLCRVIGNLIDNSIEAVINENNKKIYVFIDIDDTQIQIDTKNDCNSLITKNTKRTNRGHGKIILNEIAKKYNGSYSYLVQENCYTTKTVLQNISV